MSMVMIDVKFLQYDRIRVDALGDIDAHELYSTDADGYPVSSSSSHIQNATVGNLLSNRIHGRSAGKCCIFNNLEGREFTELVKV
eukprot:scaffold2264_cov70-Cylindrotheca_fusiformis.AAC.2